VTRFLFVGDSVTDCGRTFFAPDVGAGELGAGWVRIVAGTLGRREPERHSFLNAGVSGDRVGDLLERWDRDVVDHAPEVLTILIGVNDVLLPPPTAPDAFAEQLERVLSRIPPSVDLLVVAEPFVVPATPEAVALQQPNRINVEAVRRAAAGSANDAVLVPLDAVFEAACSRAAPSWWALDGVHPSVAGHALIAEAWLDAVDQAWR
jgi:lysophospholipase L1-like esterase